MKVDSVVHRAITVLRRLAVGVCLRGSRWLSFRLVMSGRCVSQLGQDLFALSYRPLRTGGFFVEFGAADGKRFSNTHMLEKVFGWTGILAEPVRECHQALYRERHCSISDRAVWSNSTDTVTIDVREDAQLSSIAGIALEPVDPIGSRVVRSYEVACISLNDLLAEYAAPSEIDYMSIDVEGAELQILEAFDFSSYRIRVISVEHNWSKDRKTVQHLLARWGFRRKLEILSRWDDWYVNESVG